MSSGEMKADATDYRREHFIGTSCFPSSVRFICKKVGDVFWKKLRNYMLRSKTLKCKVSVWMRAVLLSA